jgi:hypothetical protein
MSRNKPLISAILTMVLFYLLFSFVRWDLNAKHWSIEARTMYALFSPIFSIWIYSGIKINQL